MNLESVKVVLNCYPTQNVYANLVTIISYILVVIYLQVSRKNTNIGERKRNRGFKLLTTTLQS